MKADHSRRKTSKSKVYQTYPGRSTIVKIWK